MTTNTTTNTTTTNTTTTNTTAVEFIRAMARLRAMARTSLPEIIVISGLDDPHYDPRTDRLVGTHSGVIHADDASFVMLDALFNATHTYGQRVCVMRTRDPELLAKCDLVGDVGLGELDHHDFRKKEVGEVIPGVTHSAVTLLAAQLGILYVTPCLTNALAAIAAQDNGQDRPVFARQAQFDWVHDCNPFWDETRSFDAAFEDAVNRGLPIMQRLMQKAVAEIEAGPYLESLPKDQELVELCSGGLPWQEYLVPSKAVFTLYPGTEGDWRLQAVPPEVGSFKQKLPIENPRKGASFNFQAGTFLAGWWSRDDAVAAAEELLSRGSNTLA